MSLAIARRRENSRSGKTHVVECDKQPRLSTTSTAASEGGKSRRRSLTMSESSARSSLRRSPTVSENSSSLRRSVTICEVAEEHITESTEVKKSLRRSSTMDAVAENLLEVTMTHAPRETKLLRRSKSMNATNSPVECVAPIRAPETEADVLSLWCADVLRESKDVPTRTNGSFPLLKFRGLHTEAGRRHSELPAIKSFLVADPGKQSL